jgi:6-phosphogluconolactonase (cycloisomerase 2 family)
MQSLPKLLRTIPAVTTIIVFCVTSLCAADNATSQSHYLITNNDVSSGNSASFYPVSSNGSLQPATVVSTGGTGVNGVGSVATKRISILENSNQQCAYVSNAGSANLAAIDIATLTLAGVFKAESTDSGSYGVGVVDNGKYVYASFTGSNTLATFKILPGCKLHFLGDVAAAGINGGSPLDMKTHGDILVMSFQDGSIESFNLSGGVPVSNGDLQLSTGYTQDHNVPSGVDISANGQYAIFGGTLTPPMVEVSDISSGKLTPTVVYQAVGTGYGSDAIWLSPNGKLLYLSNFTSNSVTAASFDQNSGEVSELCMGAFRGIGYMSGLATASQKGTGGVVYVIEADQGIGFGKVTTTMGTCSIDEAASSPEGTPYSSSVESSASFPPRPF